MEQVEIRPTTVDDISELRAMWAQSWRETYPSPEHRVSKTWVEERTARWLTPEGIARAKEQSKDIYGSQDHFHYVATLNGRIVGMIHVLKTENGYHVGALYVDKSQYGTGLAQKLMDAALSWCDPRKPIDLELATYNERGKAFYRKYGFKEVAGSDHLYAETIPTIVMKREGGAR